MNAKQAGAPPALPPPLRALLAEAARHGTPSYVYLLDEVGLRVRQLERAFCGRFGISFAAKSNPNIALLAALRPLVATLDCSSAGELERGIAAGFPPERLTFSGPAKRDAELATAVGLGAVRVICESGHDLDRLGALAAAAGRRMPFLLRINPARLPRRFGAHMGGGASQFGVDEEDVDGVLARHLGSPWLELEGLHAYSASNSLSPDAICENFGIFAELFADLAKRHDLRPRTLVFGSGFGIPYTAEQRPLDLEQVATLANPLVDELRAQPNLAGASCVLEMGRFLVGPAGYFLTSVVNTKRSRGVEVRMCDGGMNDHLAACGLMGMVIRRNFPMWKVSGGDERPAEVMLTGPLCTTIDLLAAKVVLPWLERGDVVAIGSSGAYGLTASPTAFISHPPPRELLVRDGVITDVTKPAP